MSMSKQDILFKTLMESEALDSVPKEFMFALTPEASARIVELVDPARIVSILSRFSASPAFIALIAKHPQAKDVVDVLFYLEDANKLNLKYLEMVIHCSLSGEVRYKKYYDKESSPMYFFSTEDLKTLIKLSRSGCLNEIILKEDDSIPGLPLQLMSASPFRVSFFQRDCLPLSTIVEFLEPLLKSGDLILTAENDDVKKSFNVLVNRLEPSASLRN